MMEETRIQIGDEVLFVVDISADWYISGAGYDGESVNITLRKKSDRESCWTFNEPQTETQTETQDSNLTFEKRTMRDCYNCKRYETEGECIECNYEPKDETQTDCPWR